MEREKRSALERFLMASGAAGFSGGVGSLVGAPGKRLHQAGSHAAGGFLQQGGAELGGALGGDSLGSRALGGALGGAAGGAVTAATMPGMGAILRYLVSTGMSPKKAAGILLGGGAALQAPIGAIYGMLTGPGKKDG